MMVNMVIFAQLKKRTIFIFLILFYFGMTVIYVYSPTRILRRNSVTKRSNRSADNGWLLQDYDAVKTNPMHSKMENLQIDFVYPIKREIFSLKAEDKLYESTREKSQNVNRGTGNYRCLKNIVWDPYPEYKMSAFGHNLHLKLHRHSSLTPYSPYNVLNNTYFKESENIFLGCYYTGFVHGDYNSAVAVSLCNGMTGYIRTSFGSFLIQPLQNCFNNTNSKLHKIWKRSKQRIEHFVQDVPVDIEKIAEVSFPNGSRRKRNFVNKQLFTMEVLVAVDTTMTEFHTTNLKAYVLTLISIVSNIFIDSSIGNSINISVPTILLLKDDFSLINKQKTLSASQLLKQFCSLLARKGIRYDTAIMLTRNQICRNERETKCDTLGLAELGTVCKKHSCSIVQDNGLPAAFTIAHELGHILNMPHDDDSKCFGFKSHGKSPLNIMSSTMGDDIHPWSWSDCSRHFVSEFLEKEDTTCLEDNPQLLVENQNLSLPGEMYGLDEQCRLIHGNHSNYCSIESECSRLWCKAEKHQSYCRSSNLPWADGTPCGNDRSHWCQQGICRPREKNIGHVINGGWSRWGEFSVCSMTCGGGVMESKRECNNPIPMNGGKYCVGSRKKYRSCNTQNCPESSLDPREQQCFEMNGKSFGLKGVGSSVRWIPKYNLIGRDKCKLYCRWETSSAYFQLSDRVKDGTTCSFDSFDKCVNGVCRPAGCDNELNSEAKLVFLEVIGCIKGDLCKVEVVSYTDKCGVCEGKNSTCAEYSGNFYKSNISNTSTSMYHYVTTIPKGSSNIIITQPGYHAHNYIVLFSSDRKPLLNGDRVINVYRYVFFYGGVSFEYNGSNNTIEKVNSTYSRKLKKDLIVEIISLNVESMKNNSILLSFSYTAEKSNGMNHYEWVLGNWSQCDQVCQGTSYQIADCMNTTSGLKVSPPFCSSSKKPRREYKPCNTHCYLTLKVTSISKCSASCGLLGTRRKTYSCIKTFKETKDFQTTELRFCGYKSEMDNFEECREACWDYSNWSTCSKTCGNGLQVRSVECFLNGTQVDHLLCDTNTKLDYKAKIRPCSVGSCSDWLIGNEQKHSSPFWVTDKWDSCNDSCEKIRNVSCSISNTCEALKKPIDKKKCCAIKYIPTWSQCSVKCGNGTRRKEFFCAKIYKSERKNVRRNRQQIDSKFCSGLQIPSPKRLKKSCHTTCKWIPDSWSTCPSNCSKEYQTRSVNCKNMIGQNLATRYCESREKPLTKQICSHCVRREYKMKQCNCEGYRKRRVICSDTFGKTIHCPKKQKILLEKCKRPEECFPNTCAEIKRSHKIFTDREYIVFIKQKPIKIYCHNMNERPQEYITLNASENFATFYDKKSQYPDICPPESKNYEYKDPTLKFGRTHFLRVAININDLRVNENDFTFAHTDGNAQAFGSAGDCYNRNRKCPQGDFSINFNLTGFSISSETRWDLIGSEVIMNPQNDFHLSSTVRKAFCGGFCGRCKISTRSGLFLNV